MRHTQRTIIYSLQVENWSIDKDFKWALTKPNSAGQVRFSFFGVIECSYTGIGILLYCIHVFVRLNELRIPFLLIAKIQTSFSFLLMKQKRKTVEYKLCSRCKRILSQLSLISIALIFNVKQLLKIFIQNVNSQMTIYPMVRIFEANRKTMENKEKKKQFKNGKKNKMKLQSIRVSLSNKIIVDFLFFLWLAGHRIFHFMVRVR